MADGLSISLCLRACLLCVIISYCSGQQLNTACIEMKKTYTDKGFNDNDVPIKAVTGEELSICRQKETCCTQTMEEKLLSLSRKEHKIHLDESFKVLKTTFESRTRKFDEFFTELLDKAKEDLHEMFVRTYGYLYQQNAHIFTQLFDDLRAYYKGKDKNLMDVMNNFFSTLFQKMFQLLNRNAQFDDAYMACVAERMSDLKPFLDVPFKLSTHVKRAFIAARTFVQGLAIGRDVLNTVMEIQPTDSCVRGVLRLIYCPQCRGLTNTKPCNNFCLNTMKGCLAYHADLNEVWNEYIEALNKLAVRLEGPFNIESVVDPIDVKISDAIMNMQESSQKVTKSIFHWCGEPKLTRNRRNAEKKPGASKSGAGKSGGRGKSRKQLSSSLFNLPRHNNARPTTAAGTSLDRLVRDIKDKVANAKDFWINLPYNVCNNAIVDPTREEDCWNGSNRARYQPEVQKDGVLHQINNPEVEVDVSKHNSIVATQRLRLEIITNKLKHAYLGEDVQWIDTEIDGELSGSGSGDFGDDVESGSGEQGSGVDRTTDDEDDFELEGDNLPPRRKDDKDRDRDNKDKYRPEYTRRPPKVDEGNQDKENRGNKDSSSCVLLPSWILLFSALFLFLATQTINKPC